MPITTPNNSYNNRTSFLRTFLRILPGAFVWFNIVGLIYLAIFDQRLYFIVTAPVFIFNFYLTVHIAWFSRKGIDTMIANQTKDFYREYVEKRKKMLENEPTDPTPNAIQHPTSVLNWDDIIHYVIIPNYKEDPTTLQEMINSIAASKIAKTHIIVVLAMEEREQGCDTKAEALIGKYDSMFRQMMFTVHPPNLLNEQAGKSSNEAWAAAEIHKHVEQNRYDPDNVVITVCDADSNFHPKHFDNVTMKFCLEEDRYTKVYQAPMIQYKNFHSIPATTRTLSMAVSLHEIAALADEHDHHIPFSTYSISYRLASQTGGWDGDIIAEDWHMYIKSFFTTEGKTFVEPIFFPVTCYAVESDTSYWQSLVDRYEQAKRHAWGISEISYLMYKTIESVRVGRPPKTVPLLGLLWKCISLHYFGCLNFFVIVLTGILLWCFTWIPSLHAMEHAPLILGTWSAIFRYTNAVLAIPIVFTIASHMRLAGLVLGPEQTRWIYVLRCAMDWFVFGAIANIVFASYPEVWAATKLMFTDQIRYIVASKPTSALAVTETVTIEENNDEIQVEIEEESETANLVK